MKTVIREIIITVLLAVVIFMAIRTVAHNFEVSGNSMEPNLHHGEFVIVSKIAYWFDSPDRGDIVVYYTDRLQHDVIHRVVGLPGETVEIKNGEVYINDEKLDEPYIGESSRAVLPMEVPEGHYYIVGDNRGVASWEVVPEEDIVGKAWISYWPTSEWGSVPNYSW
jgi:signal peptidase I